jgi:hypothetical protein
MTWRERGEKGERGERGRRKEGDVDTDSLRENRKKIRHNEREERQWR